MIKKILGTVAIFALPVVVAAQAVGLADDGSGGQFGTLLVELLDFTNKTLIPFILGIGFLVFVWGMFRYFIAGGANDEAKEQGKSLMVYATLGFVLVIVFWGIVNLVASSTGLDDPSVDFNKNGLKNIDLTP
jgi:uncharacterized membrane protein YidH (DUF202 family)